MLDTLLLILLTAVLSPFIYPVALLTVLPIGALSIAYCSKRKRDQEIDHVLEDESKRANKGREDLITFFYEGKIISLIQSSAFINAERCLQANQPEQAIVYLNQCSKKIQLLPDHIIRYAQALKLMGNPHGALAKLAPLLPEAMEKPDKFIAVIELRADCCRQTDRYADELDCYEAVIACGHALERYYPLLGQAKLRVLERSPYLSEAEEVILQRSGTPEAFASTILDDLGRALEHGTRYQAEILSYQAYCLICMRRYDDALPLLRRSEELKKDIANNHVCSGICYLEKNDPLLAETNLKKGISCDAADDRAYFYLSKLYHLKGSYDEAILSASKSLALFPHRDECYDIQGKSYLKKRMYVEAIPCYTKAIELHPKAGYFLSRASCYYFAGSTKENHLSAYHDAQSALKLEKTLEHQIAVLKYQSAVWCDIEKRLAKDEIDARLEPFEETSQYKTEIGSIYFFSGHFNAAETYFRDEYDAHPDSRAHIFNYALVLRQLGRSDEAALLLEKVYEPDMDDIRFYNLLMDCYRDIGDVAGRDKIWHEINGVKKRYMMIDKKTGDELYQIGKFSAAIEYYLSALLHVDTSLAVYNNLACAYIRMKQYNDATRSLEKVLRLDNDYPPAHYNLGCCYLLTGKHHLSEESFRSAQRLGMHSMTKAEISSFNNMTSILLGLDTASSFPGEVQISISYC